MNISGVDGWLVRVGETRKIYSQGIENEYVSARRLGKSIRIALKTNMRVLPASAW